MSRTADVFNAKGEMVQADRVPRQPVVRHELINRPVAIDNKMRRDVHFPSFSEFPAPEGECLVVKCRQRCAQRRRGGPVNDNHLRRYMNVLRRRIVVRSDVGEGELSTPLGKPQRPIKDAPPFVLLRQRAPDFLPPLYFRIILYDVGSRV